ncbi:MAG: hypothetical protein HOY78_01700 [Saccharothrix sp.]|nr:hypothetical protein [Saccharothrix sp.]
MRTAVRRRFREDPFAYLDNLRRRTPVGVVPLPWCGEADPTRGRRFHDGATASFVGPRPNRPSQVDAVREVLRAFIPTYDEGEGVAEPPTGSR